jgi:perosamine synthetase
MRAAVGPSREVRLLEEAFEARYGLKHVFILSSGRAGMTVLLRALAERAPGRNEVVVPGYTCYSVAASAVRAGLRVRPVEVSSRTLDLDRQALEPLDLSRTVAIAGTSLYGIPVDLPGLERFARDRGVAFIDDAAQCLDGRVGERWAGSFGDAGLYSFDKGKNITSLQGGVVACRDDELGERLGHAFRALPAPPASEVAVQSMKLLAYALLLRPSLYWIPNRALTLGETPFELDYPTTQLADSLAGLVRRQFARIDALTASRVRAAERIRAALSGARGLVLPDHPGARSVYPRFPVVLEDGARRDALLARLVGAGFGATGSYPLPLVDVPGLKPHLAEGFADTPRARAVAQGMLTLPTHGHVSDADIATMTAVVAAS